MNKPSRNHHTIPMAYLKGFVLSNSPFIWAYEAGRPYYPGTHALKNNPYKLSIKQATVHRDFYARTRPDGTKDYVTYEQILAYKEQKAFPILQRLRACEELNIRDKYIFADYLAIMLKRVPKRMRQLQELWLSITNQMKDEKEKQRFFEKHGIPVEITSMYDEIVDKKVADSSDDIRLEAMVSHEHVAVFLARRKWVYYRSHDIGFLTSDNPFCFSERTGLINDYLCFLFPISRNVLLLGLNEDNLTTRFPVDPSHFREFHEYTTSSIEKTMHFNEFIAACADKIIFYSHNMVWVVSMVNKKHVMTNI